MSEFSSFSKSEIVKPSTLDTGSFDPDKRIDVNRQIDRNSVEGYNVDKRLPVCSEKSEATVSSDEIKTRTPENHGNWDGERGNSMWYPDRDYVPPEKSRNPDKPYSNPDNLSWGKILDKYGLDGIEFKDGFPVFNEISRGTVEIDDFETGGSDAKDRNFKRADIVMAEQRGCAPQEVKEWRENNNYTWHECEDKRTMQKVPNEVHANVSHDGGRSQ